MGHDVVDSVSKRLDRTGVEASAVVMDALPSLAILLVVNLEGGSHSVEQNGQWSSVGNDSAPAISEGDILDPELFGSALLVVTTVGAFSYSKQVVEGNIGKVARGLGERVGATPGSEGIVVGHRDRNC